MILYAVIININIGVIMDNSGLVQALNLEPHPEGGFFRRSYESNTICQPDQGERLTGSAIYYLLDKQDFSSWHRIQSDELWHHYMGSAFRIRIINPQTQCIEQKVVGSPFDNPGSEFQQLVPKNHWFSAELVDKTTFGLAGCSLSPAFHFDDFELADESLLSEFPALADEIRSFLKSY